MHKQASSTRRRWIIALCWLTVVFEGFDIVALGAAIPTLLDTPAPVQLWRNSAAGYLGDSVNRLG